jgi:hypothetical protein
LIFGVYPTLFSSILWTICREIKAFFHIAFKYHITIDLNYCFYPSSSFIFFWNLLYFTKFFAYLFTLKMSLHLLDKMIDLIYLLQDLQSLSYNYCWSYCVIVFQYFLIHSLLIFWKLSPIQEFDLFWSKARRVYFSSPSRMPQNMMVIEGLLYSQNLLEQNGNIYFFYILDFPSLFHIFSIATKGSEKYASTFDFIYHFSMSFHLSEGLLIIYSSILHDISNSKTSRSFKASNTMN